MANLTDAIRTVYAQVHVPDWAAANLDALTDVLRDLSWLAPGEVAVHLPEVLAGLDTGDARRVLQVLDGVEAETADRARPVRLTGRPPHVAHT